jgi:hypothetical protein
MPGHPETGKFLQYELDWLRRLPESLSITELVSSPVIANVRAVVRLFELAVDKKPVAG